MPEAATIRDYDIHVYWDSRAEYFVAEIQEIYTCAADGATQAEAMANLEETFAVLKEAYAEESMHLPGPNPELPISIQELSVLSDVIKVSRLAELSGIPVQTLATKMRRGTELSVTESWRVSHALEESGLALVPTRVKGHTRGPLQLAEERQSSYGPAGRLAAKSVSDTPGVAEKKGSGRQRRAPTGQVAKKRAE
jgi:predicted RNase H-like HicB family nuclease